MTEDERATRIRDGRTSDQGAVALLLSIVIPAYNAETTVGAAIQSAVGQAGAPFEVIVVDDGSTDHTREIADAFAADNPCAKVVSQENGGTASALNLGCSLAAGEFVSALGADDRLSPDYLEVMEKFIQEHPGYDIYSHDMLEVWPGEPYKRSLGWDDVRSVSLDDLLDNCVISGGGTFVRRTLFERLAGYRTDMYNEDHDLWLRALAEGGKHIYVPAALYFYYRSWDRSWSKTTDPVPMFRSAIAMFENIVEHYPLTAVQLEIARGTINRYETYLSEADVYGGRTKGQVVEERAAAERAWLRGLLGSMLSDRKVDALMRFARAHGWVVRPFRKAAWRIMLLRKRLRGGGV